MKIWILATVMMMGVAVTAQEKRERQEPMKPEQRAELRVKQMDLSLDLNEKQEKELQKLFAEKAKQSDQVKAQRKAARAVEADKPLSADQRFEAKKKGLDERIAMKAEVKKILTTDQFTKWEAMKKERGGKITKSDKKLKNQRRR